MQMYRLTTRITGSFLLILQAALLQIIWFFNLHTFEDLAMFLAFNILTGIGLLAAIVFFFLRQPGWLLAMVVQGLCLATALSIYFRDKNLYVQIIMLYSILMVLYLNSYHVQSAFRPSSADNTQEEQSYE